MSRPRIVHVYKDVYPPVEGGIERTIYNMARFVRRAVARDTEGVGFFLLGIVLCEEFKI